MDGRKGFDGINIEGWKDRKGEEKRMRMERKIKERKE